MSSKVYASIVIPSKDRPQRLQLVLQALGKQIDGQVEVIVVLDGCQPATLQAIENCGLPFSPIVIECSQVGRAAARNQGIRHASGEIIILLDDDRIPCLDFVAKHLSRHAERSVVLGDRRELYLSEDEINQFCQSRAIETDFARIASNSIREPSEMVRALFLLSPRHPLRWLGFVTGNVSVRRTDLLRVGGFDERFVGWGWEDTELGYRLARASLAFTKDFSIVSYHLEHDHSRDTQSCEEVRNYRYFLGKIRHDHVSSAILRLLYFRSRWRAVFKLIGGSGSMAQNKAGRM